MIERRAWAWGAGAALGALVVAGAAGRAHAASSHLSGSVYVDYWWMNDRQVASQSPSGITPEGSLKVGVDVTDDVSFSAKACFSCHGIEMEHMVIEYMPKTWFNVQAGRLAVPFGEFGNRYDPSSHVTVSAPLIYDMGRMAYGAKSAFNLGVVPTPYVDTGAMVYGQFWIGSRLQVWYGAYAVAGMRGGNDVDFTSMRTIYYSDNNRLPAAGGRMTLTFSQADPDSLLGDVSVGGSVTGGRYDKAESLGYLAWGADASLKLGPFTVRGEYASRRTDLNPSATGYPYALLDPWFQKSGWYGELEFPLGKRLVVVLRGDELRREGAPLPGAPSTMTPDSRIRRYTGGLMWTPSSGFFVKAAYEYWQPTDFPELHTVHLGIGGAF